MDIGSFIEFLACLVVKLSSNPFFSFAAQASLPQTTRRRSPMKKQKKEDHLDTAQGTHNFMKI